MPASQLTQLKTALTSAGLDRKTTSKKDRKTFKKGGARETDRAKTLARLEGIRKTLNKFDELETKTKHDVGGRQIKGVVGKPSASKQAGLDQRRKTLLPEHQLRGHRATFRDRRFGEADPTMSMEDRMLERYTRERQRGQGRKGIFNLEDDTEDPFDDLEDGTALGGLTHGGRNVMELRGDDFEMQGLGSDEEESGQTRRMDPGPRRDMLDGDEPERPKTKAEVMSEVIAKSKSYKLERQQQKEQDEDLRNELDEGIDGLRELLQEKPEAGPSRPKPQETPDVDYDQFVRSLAYDARSKPKNRTKTEEEMATEEAEALRAAEAKRLRRMRGDESDDEGVKKRGEGDDLEDDFMEDDLLGPGLTREDIENMDMPESEEDEDEDESRDEEDEDEESDVAASDMEDLEDDPDEVEHIDLVTAKPSKKRSKLIEIPFTFPCPTSVDELEDIMANLDESALPTVVQRIRTCHHPSLAEGNKAKLQTFFGVLVDYTLMLASRSTVVAISPLIPHVIALLKLNPITAAHYFVAKLSLMQKNLTQGLARGADNLDAKTYPGAAELVLLRIIGMVWSTSDFAHPVVAPAMLLMGQYLAQARIRRLSDVASGLFLCSLAAQYESLSKRLIPEAVSFVNGAIQTLFPLRKGVKFLSLRASGLSMTNPNIAPATADFASLSANDGNESAKAAIAATALRLVATFAELHVSSPAFIEMYEPLRGTLQACRANKLSPSLQTLYSKTLASLSRMLDLSRSTRQPLSLQAHKPIPIATFAPKFEDDFAPGRHYDPDVERNAQKKIRTLYKKERSGAIRELRKDNRFLAGEKSREQADKDQAYNAKMRRVHGSITSERAEEKQMEREKARQKRRK